MDIANFIKQSGTFLKAEEVKKNPTGIFVITTEPHLVDSEYEGKKQQKIRIEGEFAKEPRIMDLSKTNSRIIASKLGNDTKAWIGHQLVLTTYQTMSTKGKLVDANLVKEVR